MTFAIGVDIGGSAIKFAVVDQAGRIVWPPGRPGHGGTAARVGYRVATPGAALLAWQATGEEELITYEVTPNDNPGANLVDGKWVVPAAVARAALAKALHRVAASFAMPAVAGIGATGLIGSDGIVREGYAFTGYRGTDWVAVASEAGFKGLVQVLNDARAAAWAEYAREYARQRQQ